MPPSASQASSDYDHDETLAKMVKVAEAEVHKKHSKRVRTVVGDAQKKINQIHLDLEAINARHSQELQELLEASKTRLVPTDDKLAELWSQMDEAKNVAIAAQTEFIGTASKLLQSHGATREEGARFIRDVLGNQATKLPITYFLALDEPSAAPSPTRARKSIKGGRASDVTLVNPSSDEEE